MSTRTFTRSLNELGPSAGMTFRTVGTETCPRVEVGSFEGWVAALPRGRWKKLATARRRMHAQPGFSHTLVEAAGEIDAAVRAFDTLRLQSWWQRGRLHELAPADPLGPSIESSCCSPSLGWPNTAWPR